MVNQLALRSAPEIPSGDWLDLGVAAKLLSITPRALRKRISTGCYVSRQFPGNGGLCTKIALSSLPADARFTYTTQQAEADRLGDAPEEFDMLGALCDWERRYVMRFLLLYELTKALRGNQLKLFLEAHKERHGEGWSYSNWQKLKGEYEKAGRSISAIRPKWGKTLARTIVGDEDQKIYNDAYLTGRQLSSVEAWKEALGAAALRNPDLDVSKYPSHMAFYRRLRREVPETVIAYKREGLARWKARYGYSINRNYDDLLCGEVWVSDHVQSDVAVTTADGRTAFPWITVWVDVKSRKWLGWCIHLESPKSDHIFTAFFRAAKRYGVPTDVIIDNGKDYRCKALSGGRVTESNFKVSADEAQAIGMFADLQITVHFAWPYNPESKICERTFSTHNSRFSRHCAGYRGPNVIRKPDELKKDLSSDRLWSFDDFEKNYSLYIDEGYNREASDGKTLQGLSPNQLWDIEYPRAVAEQRVRFYTTSALRLFSSPLSEPLTIYKSTVTDRKYGIRYYAPWMATESCKVRMRRDESDYTEAWFWDAETGRDLGTATIDANPSALARTPVAKAELDKAIERKRLIEKSVRNFIKVSARDNDQFVERDLAAIAKIEKLSGVPQVAVDIARNVQISAMDLAIANESSRRKSGTYDYASEAAIDDTQSRQDDELDLWGVKAVNF